MKNKTIEEEQFEQAMTNLILAMNKEKDKKVKVSLVLHFVKSGERIYFTITGSAILKNGRKKK